VILYRCFAWRVRARSTEPDGALWFARPFQGDGRHDNPDAYGCLYLCERAVSAVVEQFARFRGQRLTDGMLVRRRLPLALATIELPESERLIDLDEPRVLEENALRPSLVATRRRELTQQQALGLFERNPRAAGLRWWSTFESLWANATLFDRAAGALRLVDVRRLALGDAALVEAAEALGIAA
jgi:hypothetical protein